MDLREVGEFNAVATVPGEQWWSQTESPKAWMSIRDADLYETLLHRLADRRDGQRLRVLEWGAGRSTIWYTRFLDALGVDYSWLAIEHNGGFVRDTIEPVLHERQHGRVMYAAGEHHLPDTVAAALSGTRIVVVAFDHGPLFPAVEGNKADRAANLDDYVDLPAQLGATWDLVVIDGRKRRRCMLEGARLIGRHGYVLLHDAWRRHYQCAWSAFRSGRRFGDEWWIGGQAQTSFADVLPWHAFERHQEST